MFLAPERRVPYYATGPHLPPLSYATGAKGAEAPPLAKLKLSKKMKYRIVLFFYVTVCVIWPIYGLKIDFDTVKLLKVT